MSLRALALNPFHGGSHRAFLEGWWAASRHQFELLCLPPYKWKWRMRHAAITFSRQLCGRDPDVDVIFCSDMLNVAEFRGLAPGRWGDLPVAMYFHENQLTYPVRDPRERDLHFAFTNLVSAAAADAVWFNTRFHHDEFLAAAAAWMRRMPDYQLGDLVDEVAAKAKVLPPGIVPADRPPPREAGPLRIVWVSRWEHDKGPDVFFQALRQLSEMGSDFRLLVLGQSYGTVPECFAAARQQFASQIDHWGYAVDGDQYRMLLRRGDVVVSTATHEFFGIGVLEAVDAGCRPLVPRRLAYPETLGEEADYFFDGTAVDLARRLAGMALTIEQEGTLPPQPGELRERVARYHWPHAAARLDEALQEVARRPPS